MNRNEQDFERALKKVIKYLVVWTLILIALALLMSCSTTEYVPVVQTNTEHHWHTDSVKEHDSIYHEKQTTIMQLDSAAMAKYGIQLKAAERAWLVKTEELERQIQRLQEMSATRDSIHDSIPVPVPVIKTVPADLTLWQEFRLHLANILLYTLLIAAGYGVFRLWRVYKFF